MPRPSVIVTVSAALPRRGDPTATGTAMLAFVGASGPTTPIRCTSPDAAKVYGTTAAATAIVDLIADTLAQGAPEVIAVRVAPAGAQPTEAEWSAALDLIGDTFPASGQVAIPGVTTAEAHQALAAHALSHPSRTVFLDAEPDADAAELIALATSYADDAAAARIAVVAPSVSVPGRAGTTRVMPGSAIGCALAARGDARAGHANNAPAGDQGFSVGAIRGGRSVTATFTDTERDDLHDAGVSIIRLAGAVPTLWGWRSVSTDERFTQLNAGRFAGQLGGGIAVVAAAFLFRQIDGRGLLFSELDGALRGYLLPLWAASALYGAEPDDAFDVVVDAVNTPATIAAGELHAAVEVALTPHAERVVIDVVTHIATGA